MADLVLDPRIGFFKALAERLARRPAEFFPDQAVVRVAATNTQRAEHVSARLMQANLISAALWVGMWVEEKSLAYAIFLWSIFNVLGCLLAVEGSLKANSRRAASQ